MIKIFKCKFCGKSPHLIKCTVPELKITEYKVMHYCRKNRWSGCGNWYETKRMSILDWNMHRCNGKGGILPRRNNYFLRNDDMYYTNGKLIKE